MASIWEPENKFRIWLDIELAVCEAHARRGIIPPEDIEEIRRKADFDLERIYEIESEVHHDVIAFLTAVAEKVGPASRHIHFGLTSSDIGDTALSLQMRQAGMIIRREMVRVIEELKKLALAHRETLCMGRSHGVHAEPTTFGVKMLLHHQAFTRNLERLDRALETISHGKLSGAVGTFSNISPEVEQEVCESLGLKPDPVTTQVITRDRHAEFMSVLGIIAGSMDQVATEIRHLQRTEVREVEEPFQRGQKGSSAMPHKRNPILCERVSGLSRIVKANVSVALDNMTLWHERDISHSSAERVALPDSTLAVDYLLDRLAFVLGNLHVYPEAMMKNIERTGGLFYSQAFLLALVEKGKSREEAYSLVQSLAMRVWQGEGSLRELAASEKRIGSLLTEEELDSIFTPDRYLTNIGHLYRRTGLE
jgi:adenylosuccinate lyase